MLEYLRGVQGEGDRMSKLQGTAFVACALVLVETALPCAAQSLDPPSQLIPQATLDGQPGGDFAAGDGRRTLGAFPKNLGRTFAGVFSRDNLTPLLFGVATTAAFSFADQQASSLITGSCPSCGQAGQTLGGSALVPVMGAFFVAGRFAPQGRFRAASYDFAQALIVTEVYTGALKYTVQRERPDGSNSLSFPSGHASAAFTLATVADHHYGWKVGVPAYVLASGIGLSRVEKNKHYLSDVIAGATIGVIVGRTVTRVNDEQPGKKRRLVVGPASDLHGAGVGLNVSMSW
jgi:membrane-associated phospholipid phosphatase